MRRCAWIQRVDRTPQRVVEAIETGVTAVDRLPRSGERWAVKLNLTYPTYLPGVVNSPVFVEGLCRWAADHGVALIFVEGYGGNGSYSAEDAFRGNGITALAMKYGMRCASLSKGPWEWRESEIQGRSVRLPYSPFFRDRNYDIFITTPLFKNHIYTYVTLGMKNLWGCIPDPHRILYHHILDLGIVALYKELLPEFSIFDGLIALRGRGPMEGEPVDLDAVLVSSDVGTGEAAALRIMNIPLAKSRHLEIAAAEGIVPTASEIRWLADPRPFERSDFVVKKTLINHLSITLARSPRLQHLVYHSPLSPAIYAVVNRIRGDSALTKLYKDKVSGKFETILVPKDETNIM
jgi:uncharacterized protein (DUF362 family)